MYLLMCLLPILNLTQDAISKTIVKLNLEANNNLTCLQESRNNNHFEIDESVIIETHSKHNSTVKSCRINDVELDITKYAHSKQLTGDTIDYKKKFEIIITKLRKTNQQLACIFQIEPTVNSTLDIECTVSIPMAEDNQPDSKQTDNETGQPEKSNNIIVFAIILFVIISGSVIVLYFVSRIMVNICRASLAKLQQRPHNGPRPRLPTPPNATPFNAEYEDRIRRLRAAQFLRHPPSLKDTGPPPLPPIETIPLKSKRRPRQPSPGQSNQPPQQSLS